MQALIHSLEAHLDEGAPSLSNRGASWARLNDLLPPGASSSSSSLPSFPPPPFYHILEVVSALMRELGAPQHCVTAAVSKCLVSHAQVREGWGVGREGVGNDGVGGAPALRNGSSVQVPVVTCSGEGGDEGQVVGGGRRLGAPQHFVTAAVTVSRKHCQSAWCHTLRCGRDGGGQRRGTLHSVETRTASPPAPQLKAAIVVQNQVFTSASLCVLCVLQAAVVFNVLQGAIQHRNTEWTARTLDELCDNAWSHTLAGHPQ